MNDALPATEIAVTPDVKPETETGVNEAVVEPSPNWPLSLAPQHFTPPETTAHEKPELLIIPLLPATDTAVTPDVKPETETGVNEAVVEPSPNWPLSLAPQHFTPPETTAHAWLLPTEIEVTPADNPLTATGANDAVVVPLPN
jgi:hypothetical protein